MTSDGAAAAATRPAGARVRERLGRSAPWLILLASLAVHLVLVPALGWEHDLYWWDLWTREGMRSGVAHLDERVECDYPPVYLYVLKGLGLGWQALFGSLPPAGTPASRFLLKLPPVLADLLGAWVLFRLASRRLGRRSSLLVLAGYALNPATTFNSAVWGQVDSLLGLLLLLAAWAVARRRVALGFAIATIACLLKLQAVVALPVLLLAAIVLAGARALRSAFLAGSITALVVLWPFFVAHRADAVLTRAFAAVGRYPMMSMNAYNVWWLVGGGQRSFDTSDQYRVGNALLSYHTIGSIMLAVAAIVVLTRVWRDLDTRRDEALAAVLVGCSLMVIAFFLFATQMHERYIVPAITLLAAAAIFRPRLNWFYGIYSFGVAVALASTLKWGYPNGLGLVRDVFERLGLWDTLLGPGRRETFALAVVSIVAFLALLLLGCGRRFVLATAAAVAGVAALLTIVAALPLRGRVPLSSWMPVEQRQGWGTLQRDHNVDGKRIEIGEYIFRHGIGTHAVSVLTYDLNRAFDAFETGYGTDAGRWGNRVQFLISAQYARRGGWETRPLFDSGIFVAGSAPGYARVSVKGADRLVLTVGDGGDGINGDHASWLEPTLTR